MPPCILPTRPPRLVGPTHFSGHLFCPRSDKLGLGWEVPGHDWLEVASSPNPQWGGDRGHVNRVLGDSVSR